MRRIVFLLAVCILAAFAGAAVAQTPDGETPANEGVCDELLGGTPGLYGLCVAFCEAQDLDGVDIDDPDTVHKHTPSVKLLQNYRKKMKDGDPDMPCLQKPCPCWTAEQIAIVGLQGRETNACLDVNYWDPYGHEYEYVYDQEYNYPVDTQVTYGYTIQWDPSRHPWVPNEGHLCQWVDYWYSYEENRYLKYDVVSAWITPEEHASCEAAVFDQAADAGLECQVIP